MGRIKVPLNDLRELAGKLQEYSDQSNDIFNRICNSLECFEADGDWQGDSLKAAISATEKNKRKFADTIQEMSDMTERLYNYVDTLANEDSDGARKIKSV